MNTHCITEDLKTDDDAPAWPAVEWGVAGIVLAGAALLLPAGAYFLSLLGG